jgi:hypothetical protein
MLARSPILKSSARSAHRKRTSNARGAARSLNTLTTSIHVLTNADSTPAPSPNLKPASPQALSKTIDKPSPTLLTIPQELRDDIFTLVYATVVDDDMSTIGVHIVSARQAGIESHEAPPTARATLLVCKQLHTEMREMQAAAVRQYWSTHVFLINPARERSGGLHLDFIDNRNLHRVSSFTFQKCFPSLARFGPTLGRAEVQVVLDTALGWVANWDSSRLDLSHPRTMHRFVEIQQRLRDKIDLLSTSRDGGGDLRFSIDPTKGRGFTVNELDQLDASINK